MLESVTADTRKGISAGIAPVMATAGKLADTVRKAPGMPRKPPVRAPKAAPKPAVVADAPAAEPIPDYSGMTVAEIRPRLPGLSASALRKVRDRELAGKARKTVLGQIDQLLGPKA